MPNIRSQLQRPPKLRKPPTRTSGPRALGLQRKPETRGGPGRAPEQFLSAQRTQDEWHWYWASAVVFDDPADPRQPPYFGGRLWGYQLQYTTLFGVSGETNVDFAYYLPGEIIAVRIQTPFFHVAAGPEKTAYDEAQRKNLSRRFVVRDVYSQNFIGDPSGASAIRQLVELLGGRERINPAKAGTYQTVRTA